LNIQQSFDGTGINVRIEGIQPLEKARRAAVKKATIQLKSQLLCNQVNLEKQKRLVQRIQKVLESHPGSTPLALELAFEKAQVKIRPQQTGIDLSDPVCQSLFSLKREGVTLHY